MIMEHMKHLVTDSDRDRRQSQLITIGKLAMKNSPITSESTNSFWPTEGLHVLVCSWYVSTFEITNHGGDRNTCTRQEILTPCQVETTLSKTL